MARYLVQLALIVLVVIFATWRGGKPERAGATILAYLTLADPIYHALSPIPTTHVSVDLWHLLLDSTAFVAAITLALTADRFWPLCFAAMQLISTLGHLVRLIDISMDPLAYAIMIRAPSYGLIAILFVGTWLHARGSRRLVKGRFSSAN